VLDVCDTLIVCQTFCNLVLQFILQQIQNFGEPFFLVIHECETLAEIRVRIQKKLQVPDDEFAKVFLLSSMGILGLFCLK
jgi:hypothetical protein